ncbi:hypothetical protein LJC58_09460 [Lachnospiraceae bacterium OttesenSCG-928-D06]|nr:hypothetical protein [Lachnospiraceae bacterium OttesenSCG-928-D06]
MIWYPTVQYSEQLDTNRENSLLDYFYVNEDIIIEIIGLSIDNKLVSIFEFSEEKILDSEYGYPVCYTNLSVDAVEKNIFDDDLEITISRVEGYMITDMRTMDADHNRYSRYVWEKGMGLVGYQYGQGVGGNQHDFFLYQDILDKYLDRG